MVQALVWFVAVALAPMAGERGSALNLAGAAHVLAVHAVVLGGKCPFVGAEIVCVGWFFACVAVSHLE